MRDGILSRLDKLEKRVSELGSFVPPGSDSTLRGERLSETMARVFQLWNKARGELDAANQHVKILAADRNAGIAACIRSCVQTIRENAMAHSEAVEYLLGYADAVARAGQPPSGPPAPAASPNSNPLNIRVEGSLDEPPSTSRPGSDSPLREGRLAINRLRQAENSTSNPEVPAGKIRVTFEVNDAEYQALISARLPAGGPPTPDLAASPNSNTEDDDPDEPLSEQRPWPQRIGVYDYDSLVACLKSNFSLAFPDYESPDDPLPDPQDMIQLMAAEIQHLRNKKNAF